MLSVKTHEKYQTFGPKDLDSGLTIIYCCVCVRDDIKVRSEESQGPHCPLTVSATKLQT